jgi:magnesium chelatase family protein
LDRIDIQIEIPPVAVSDLSQSGGESSKVVAARINQARVIQEERFKEAEDALIIVNAQANGDLLEQTMVMHESAKTLLTSYSEKMKLSARSYYRLIRVARTIADLDMVESGTQVLEIGEKHVAEALSYRKIRLN